MKSEPLWTVSGITAGVSAVLSLLVAFGVNLTESQNNAILGVAAVAAPLVVAWFAHRKVSPAWKLRDPLPPSSSE